MTRNTIPVEWYIDAAQVFHWAKREHFNLWFTGETKRHRRTECVLNRLVKRKKLRAVQYGKRLIYAAPRKVKAKLMDEFTGLTKVAHGLACTECLVRFYRSKMEGEVIAERFFYGCGAVPDWGIRYPNGKMLLFEFSTKSNFMFTNMLNGKLSAYGRSLEKIEEKFQSEAVLVFVVDVPRPALERFIAGKIMPALERAAGSVAGAPAKVMFTDYTTFLDIPIGEILDSPIYLWAKDGMPYPLSQNVGFESD